MPVGHSWVDYVVVALCVAFTVYALIRRQELLLYALPTILSLYFIVPVVSQIAPVQIVPLILGAWLIVADKTGRVGIHGGLIGVLGICILATLAWGVYQGGAGSRPFMRALYYSSMAFTFLYAFAKVRTRADMRAAIWGLAIAGAIHSGYSLYQIFALETGLPFRAIVRGSSGGYSLAMGFGTLRVNGLASEPKRLAYVLFVAAVAAFYLVRQARSPDSRLFLLGTGFVSLLMALLTFSGSFFFAVALTILIVGSISPKLLRVGIIGLLPLSLLFIANPSLGNAAYSTIESTIMDRFDEVEVGLDGETVYRQEFYASDYAQRNPEVAAFGVGLGRYNYVFSREYGLGAGYGENARILPLNSQLLEVMFDLGAFGILLIFVCPAILLLQLGRKNALEMTLFLILSFLLLQALFVTNMVFTAFVIGITASYVHQRRLAMTAIRDQERERRRLNARFATGRLNNSRHMR
ncbi:MAG: hypothetical protein QNI84_13085 [Henriciella sp.]|nr:hypothetical protein [Henriciella sp.]